jgi:hypothetical protein
MRHWIDIVDQDVRLVVLKAAADPRGFDRLRNAFGIFSIDSFLQYMPSE